MNPNWVDIAWAMMAAASLSLGVIHLFVWQKNRPQHSRLFFFALALSTAAYGAFELAMMRAPTPAFYVATLRWAHIPLAMVVLSIVGFVHFYFGTGRPWLAGTIVAIRLASLVLNFATGANVNFLEVTSLDPSTLVGGVTVVGPVGVANPWAIVPQAGNLLLVGYALDAAIQHWRRGDADARRRALIVGGAVVCSIVAVAAFAGLINMGVVHAPTIVMPGIFLIVLAMGYELSWDLIQAAVLAEALRDSEQRVELAGRAAGLAFWSWHIDAGRVWTTERGRELFEFSGSEGIDLDALLARVHPDDRDSVRGALDQALQHGVGYEQEFRLDLPSTRLRWISARGQVELGSKGEPVLMRGVAMDVTGRVKLEQETARQRSELAQMSRVATLGELSGSLAHEINQPLMGILSNAQAAQRFLDGDRVDLAEVREIITDIVEDGKRAGEVTRRLRALLRSGEVQRAALDLNQVVEELLRLVRNDLLNRGFVVRADLEPKLPVLLGNRVQLQQVLLNLLMNACDAMGESNDVRQILVRTRQVSESGLELSVSDSGTGVPAGDMARIFEPFVTTKDQGMGLGLSVCRSIVLAHGGRLWAENNIGGGATFRVLMPLLEH